MISTLEWANSFGISGEPSPPPMVYSDDPFPHSAREIAVRAIILQGVVVVGFEVDPAPIIDWFQDQEIWYDVSPKEKAFLLNTAPSMTERNQFRWRQEAEWTLLWMISQVEALGLPTQTCDTRRLVDEIIPPLGSNIGNFLASAELRQPPILHAENERTYDLWCRAVVARRENRLPDDLNFDVLYERRYAFEWADFTDPWDQ